MTVENVLQQGPLLGRRIRLECPWIEEEEQNAFFGGIDQLARIVQVLRMLRRNEPGRDLATIHLMGMRARVRGSQGRRITISSGVNAVPGVEIVLCHSRVVNDETVVGLR